MPLNGMGLPTWALIAFVRAEPDRMCGPTGEDVCALGEGGWGSHPVRCAFGLFW